MPNFSEIHQKMTISGELDANDVQIGLNISLNSVAARQSRSVACTGGRLRFVEAAQAFPNWGLDADTLLAVG